MTLSQVTTTELWRSMKDGDPRGADDATARLLGMLRSLSAGELALIHLAAIYVADVIHESYKEAREEGR